MSQFDSSLLSKFIRKARSRIIVGIILDSIFYSLVTFACIAIPVQLIPALHPIAPLLLMIAGMILLIFLAIALLRFPSIRKSAEHLDRMNQTHDLLSTALFSAGKSDEWSTSIARIADHACLSMRLPPFTGQVAPAIHLAGWSGIGGIMLLSLLVQNSTSTAIATNIGRGESSLEERHIESNRFEHKNQPENPSISFEKSDSTSETAQRSERPSIAPGASASGTGRSDFRIESTQRNSAVDPSRAKNLTEHPTSASLTGEKQDQPVSGNSLDGTVQSQSEIHLWETQDWKNRNLDSDEKQTAEYYDPAYREMIRQYFDR